MESTRIAKHGLRRRIPTFLNHRFHPCSLAVRFAPHSAASEIIGHRAGIQARSLRCAPREFLSPFLNGCTFPHALIRLSYAYLSSAEQHEAWLADSPRQQQTACIEVTSVDVPAAGLESAES